jgi:hypothetical protein
MTSLARRTFLAHLTRFTAALPLVDWSRDMAQQRVPRLGFMSRAEPALISSFDDEMRKLGYSLGRNFHVEVRLSRMNTSDTAAHAAELGAMDLDFVVVAALLQALAMRQANPKNADGDHYVPRYGERRVRGESRTSRQSGCGITPLITS